MSRVFFIGDTHFGHDNALRFRTQFATIQEHDRHIIERWNKTVNKRDLVYHLGDFSFKQKQPFVDGIRERLNGTIKLIPGNHDQVYPKDVVIMQGLVKYREFWLSHPPIHSDELRGKRNIHGHTHSKSIPDDRYINVSCEAVDYTPIGLEKLESLGDGGKGE